MKRLIPFTLVTLLLCGCPEAKLPKPTPMVPEPKAAVSDPALRQADAVNNPRRA